MGPKFTIIHVEDNPNHAELVSRGFEELDVDLNLLLFKDGESIINYINNVTADLPQMILLDLNLPKVKGLDVLKAIRQSDRYGNIPVVILSTSEAEADIKGAYASKANSYLVKPLDFGNFQSLINTCGLYWTACNRTLPI